MDWSKAKNILIIALIATNLFLLFTYITKNQMDKHEPEEDALFAVLEDNNIFIETELPTKYGKMPAITVEYDNDKEEVIKANLFRTIYDVSPQAEDADFVKAANQFLKDCNLLKDNIILEGVSNEGDKTVVKYKICYKGIAIGDSAIECKFVKGELEDVTRQWLNPIEQKKKSLSVISPAEALLIFMSEKESDEKITIEKMELVFWVNDSSFNGEALVLDTAFPAWEITYNSGNKKYIDAYEK